MPQNEIEKNESKANDKLVSVTQPEAPVSEVDVRVEDCASGEPRTGEVGADGDATLTGDENLLAASEVQVVRRGSRLAWVLVALLFLLLVASGGLNWLQHGALTAAQSGSTQMTNALGAAQEQATRAEAEATALRSLVSDVNHGLAAVQVQISDMATRLQEADQTSRSTTSADQIAVVRGQGAAVRVSLETP